MTSSGSFNLKYYTPTSGRSSRKGERDVRGRRSMERLNSLDGERSPRLIFSTRHSSHLLPRHEAILRTSLSRSQSLSDTSNSHASPSRSHSNSPTTSTPTAATTTATTTTYNSKDENSNTAAKADSNSLSRSSSHKLPRIPSRTLRDLDLIRLNRHSDVTKRGKVELLGEEERRRQKPSRAQQEASHSSSSSNNLEECLDVLRRYLSEDSDGVVMRRKASHDTSQSLQTPERSVSARTLVSRPASLHSDRNYSSSSSPEANRSVKSTRPLSTSSGPSPATPRTSSRPSPATPRSAIVDKGFSSNSSKYSSTSVERSSSLRELRHSSSMFSERYALGNTPASSPLRSEMTVSLSNLSTATHARNSESAERRSLVNLSRTSSDSLSGTDSERQGGVHSTAATSISQKHVELSLPEGKDNKSSSAASLCVSCLSRHPTSSPSSPADGQLMENYDGSSLQVLPSDSHVVSQGSPPRGTAGEKRRRVLEVKTASEIVERTKDRSQLLSSITAEKPDEKLAVRNTRIGVSSRHAVPEKTDVTVQAAVSASLFSVCQTSSPPSCTPTAQPVRLSDVTASAYGPTKFSESSKCDMYSKTTTSADAVLDYFDHTLQSNSTDLPSTSVRSTSRYTTHQPHETKVNLTTQKEENQTVPATDDKNRCNASLPLSDHRFTNKFTKTSVQTVTATDNVTTRDLEITYLHDQGKKKGGKSRRRMTPTKVTKYEGSVKTVRRQIKPGHVEELREIFKKQEEENDKLIMRHTRRHKRSNDLRSSDDADDSGSGYTTTSSDNEYDLVQAEKLSSPDCSTIPSVYPPDPVTQWEEQLNEEDATTSRNTNTPMFTQEQGHERDGLFRDGLSVKNTSQGNFTGGDEERDSSKERGENGIRKTISFPPSSESHVAHISSAVEVVPVHNANSLSTDLTQITSCAAESTLHAGSAISLSNTAALKTSLSASQYNEAMEKDMNGENNSVVSFKETNDSRGAFQPNTGNSVTFQHITSTTNSSSGELGSNPAKSSSKTRTEAYRKTPASIQIQKMMGDTSRHSYSPPLLMTVTGGEGGSAVSESDSWGGEAQQAGQVDSEGLSTISCPNDRHHDDTNIEREGEGGKGPDSSAGKEINNNTFSSPASCLRVCESRGKFVGGEEGTESIIINYSTAFTPRQTPPLASSDRHTQQTDHQDDLLQERHPTLPHDSDRQDGERTPTDFLSLLDNIRLGTNTSFTAETAQKARQLHSQELTNKNRSSAEFTPAVLDGDSERVRKGETSGVLKLNESEDGESPAVRTDVLPVTGVTLFTNDTLTISPQPTDDESCGRDKQGTGKVETKQFKEEKGEGGEPFSGQSWTSSFTMSTSLKMDGRGDDSYATSDAKTDAHLSEEDKKKATAVSVALVKGSCMIPNDDVVPSVTSHDTKVLTDNNTAVDEPYSSVQTSEDSHTIHTDGPGTKSIPKKEHFQKEAIRNLRNDDGEGLPQTALERRFKVDVVSGNIGVKQSPPLLSGTAVNNAHALDENIRFLTAGGDSQGPSITSSQSRLEPTKVTSKKRNRQPASSRSRGKQIIVSTTRTNYKPQRETSLPDERVSHVNLAEDNASYPSVVTAVNEMDNPPTVTMSSSQHMHISDTIVGPENGDKILDTSGEQQTKTSQVNIRTDVFTTNSSVGVFVQDSEQETANDDDVAQSMPVPNNESSRASPGEKHHTQSSLAIDLDSKETTKYSAVSVSSDEERDENTKHQMNSLSAKTNDENKNDTPPQSDHEEKCSSTTCVSSLHFGNVPTDSNDRKSSRLLFLNTSVQNFTSHETMLLNNNTSFGDNDSQYGSQTSKATSIGDASPTDERLYRIVHPDTSLSSTSSSLQPANPPPAQQLIVCSSLDRKPRASGECQQGSLNRSQDAIFRQHQSSSVSDVWRTGRLSASDPDLSQSLFGSSLSTLPPADRGPQAERCTHNVRSHRTRRVCTSPSDSDEDSGVEGGRRYKSEAKLLLGATKRRAKSTSSLNNVHLSLLPHSPTPSPCDYRVSSLQRQTSWDRGQADARDESRNLYRVSKMATAEGAPGEQDRKFGQEAWKQRSCSSAAKHDESSNQGFKVLHTLTSKNTSLADDREIGRNQMPRQQGTPSAALQSFDESLSNRPEPVPPPSQTGRPTGIQQYHSIISPDVNSDTHTTAEHQARPRYLVTTVNSDPNNTQTEVDRVPKDHTTSRKVEISRLEPVKAYPTKQSSGEDTEGSSGQSSANRRHVLSDEGAEMEGSPRNRTYNVSTTAHLRQRPASLHYDNYPDYDMCPDYDNIPALPDGKRYVINSLQSLAEKNSSHDPHLSEEERITLREIKPKVISPLPEPKALYQDRAWRTRAADFSSRDSRAVHNDLPTMSPLQHQHSRNYVAFNSLDNIRVSTRDVTDAGPSVQRSFSQTLWSSVDQPWGAGPTSRVTPTQYPTSDSHTDPLFHSPNKPTQSSEQLFHQPSVLHTASATNDADDEPGVFKREVYEESSYEMRQDSTHVVPDAVLPEEERDLRVLRGKILIQNRLDDSRTEEDFLHNMNIFDTSFHLGKDNPLYQSDPDIYKSLEAELQQQEEQRRNEAIGQEVTQDVTWETVERVTQKHKEDQSRKPHPKQNLSTLLLSKLSSIHSQDIRQHIDVKHHHEDIFGDLHLMHADGSRAHSSDTSNFDSVHENIELLLKEGKAYVIIKVIAERIVPIDREFNVWRKSQAIVTRNIEIDLRATEQRRRLYQHVMDTGGRVPGAWRDVTDSAWNDVSESWAWKREDEDGGGATLRSSRGPGEEAEERHLSSLETLRLFSQILGVAEVEGEEVEGRSRQVRGGFEGPSSPPPYGTAMDLLY